MPTIKQYDKHLIDASNSLWKETICPWKFNSVNLSLNDWPFVDKNVV